MLAPKPHGLSDETLELLELTSEQVQEIITPIAIGPTWQRNADGGWLLPEHTLGWQIAAWCAEYLHSDDGEPWQFTLEQLRFLLWWYAVDETGAFVYRTGVLQRMKGWGKDPLLAVMCLVEFVGPSRFSHFDADGDPVGVQCVNALVQVTAVNQEQTDNTMSMLPSLMSDRLIQTYGIKPGVELIRGCNGRNRIKATTSNYRTIEGKRTTFTLLNETHHWVAGNGGHKMFETIDGNATKKASRYLSITNAYLPGEDSVAERQRDAYLAVAEGRAMNVGLLYDSLEAHPKAPLSGPLLPLVLERIRGDAIWLQVVEIMKSIGNTQIAPSRSRRMWLNQIVAEEESLHGPDTWDSIGDPKLILMPGDEIVMGFDGGKTDDATALVAIRVRDRAAFVLLLEEAPPVALLSPDEKWEVDRRKVAAAVHEAFRVYTVAGFYADVALWESYITDWTETYGDKLKAKATEKAPIAWDMRGSLERSTRAHERLMQAIFDAEIRHDADLRLRRHTLNAVRDTNRYGVSFRKESRESKRKVDLYAALMLAHEALTDLRTKTKKTKERTGHAWFM